MKLCAALMVLGMASASASGSATIRVEVESGPDLTFSRGVASELTVTTPWGQQQALLKSGTLYPADPEHYFSRLDPVALRVNVPAGTKPGAYPVSLKTALYVCDQNIHLCSVREAQASGELTVGRGKKPLTLTLKVPKLRSF